MNVECPGCKNELTIEDSKVPEGIFKVRCPKCGKIITSKRPDAADPQSGPEDTEKPSAGGDMQLRKEIAALKRELAEMARASHSETSVRHGEGTTADEDLRALLCESDPNAFEVMARVLRSQGFEIETAPTTVDALKRLESAVYDVVTLDILFPDDKEGGRKVIGRINGSKGVDRRKTFLILVSSAVKSMDPNAAFFHGVNLTIHKGEVQKFEAYLREGRKHFQRMYHYFSRLVAEKDQVIATR